MANLREDISKACNGDWNIYRSIYNLLTFEQLQHIHNVWDAKWPNQKRFNSQLWKDAFEVMDLGDLVQPSVVELGCHQGHLAEYILAHYEDAIFEWFGYDLCIASLNRNECRHPKYTPTLLSAPFYHCTFDDIPLHEVFCCSHTIEHMKKWEFDKLVKCLEKYETCYAIFEIAPICLDGWNNYAGAHVLDTGWAGIEQIMEDAKWSSIFDESYDNGWVTVWRKEW